ncbi:MAG TPA: glycosyltransferase [Dyella sp.]|uniref:CgeB family protein n=1 Tax=Dyella sp. TaxID=1869338 RepID=UPI002D785A02|nr:glycosyltransferase [Dyella sp.]HET6553599.1 glycosyltransferase [Dyella sp.]
MVDALRTLGATVNMFAADTSFSETPSVIDGVRRRIRNLLAREPERHIERRLLRTMQDFEPELVLVILGNQISPRTMALMRKATRAPIVCWCQDQLTTMGRQYILGSGYDMVFVKDRYMQELFSRMIRSTSFRYLPEACNPRVHRPLPLSDADRDAYGCELMIAGNLYYYRQEILQQLSEFDLKVFGILPDWLIERIGARYQRRAIFGDDKARAACAARIALNTLHFAEVNSLNCRAFELAGCGAFQMISDTPVVAEHFGVDEEIVTFRTVEELIEKARHYLRHPEATARIARAGQQRAHRDHTYEHRLLELVAAVLPDRVLPGQVPPDPAP